MYCLDHLNTLSILGTESNWNIVDYCRDNSLVIYKTKTALIHLKNEKPESIYICRTK